MVSSGICAYLGGQTPMQREKTASNWLNFCKSQGIPTSEKYSFVKTLGDPVRIRTQQSFGLPIDNFSTENGVLVDKGKSWPLMIDPQGQANKWVKAMEKNNGIFVIRLNQKKWLSSLEQAIPFGKSVILENLEENLDPALESILMKAVVRKGGKAEIKVGENMLEYNDNFRFFMTTKLRNPHQLPDVSVKVTLLNFMITPKGLADQLIENIMDAEQEEKAKLKKQLSVESTENKNKLTNLENQILKVLAESTGNILEDANAIEVLDSSKKTSNEVKERMVLAEKVDVEIEALVSQQYPCAEITSAIYFCISELANIDPMQQ